MKAETKPEVNRLADRQTKRDKSGMKLKSRVKAGVVPDAPDRWRSQIQIVARGL